MTTDKIIDIWCIIDSIEPFILEKHYEDVLEILEKHLQPEKPQSECNCKWWRHCKFCRKADSGWAGIEKIFRDEINKNIDYLIKYIGLKGNIDDMKMMAVVLWTYRNTETPTQWYGKSIIEFINKQ